MQTDIHMSDTQYLIALTVFFFPYALLEVCFITLIFKHAYLIRCTDAEQRSTEEITSIPMAIILDLDVGYNNGSVSSVIFVIKLTSMYRHYTAW